MRLTITLACLIFIKISWCQPRHQNDVPIFLFAIQAGAEKGFKWNEFNNPNDYPYVYREHKAKWGSDFNIRAAYGLNIGVLKYIGFEIGYTNTCQTVVNHFYETVFDSTTNYYVSIPHKEFYDFQVNRISAGIYGQMEAPFTNHFGLSIAQGFQFIKSNTKDIADNSRNYKEFLVQPRMNFELYFSQNQIRFAAGTQFRFDFRGNIYASNPDYPHGKWGKLIWVYWSPYISVGYRFGRIRIPKYRTTERID